ncbi:MAG: PmoA family protein [Verrucomicrobia bacterium]|nr:PmoA family protein [Verrucomicrobiota bacterium]
MHKPTLIALLSFATVGIIPARTEDFQFSVAAGDFDRRETVVTFPLPPSQTWRTSFLLQSSTGEQLPVQMDASRTLSFIEPDLPKGETKNYRLAPAKTHAAPAAGVQATRAGTRLEFRVHGKPVVSYQAEPGEFPRADIKPIYRRGGYLHPVFSPSGKLVTDDFALNHTHHHGIWFPWTKTEFEGRQPDFWNMGEGKGRVEFVTLNQSWSGAVHGGFIAQHRFVDLLAPEPKTALNETWEVKIYGLTGRAKPHWIFDLTSTQTCASASALKLAKYHYGGMGFRGNAQWDGKDNVFFLTSEGETDRVKGNETRGRWCHIGGKVDGELTGVAILCHPENFRAPQPMRLHPTEPFFCYAPSQLGDWEITPGRPYVSRYRFIVADGPPDKNEIERLWNDYAHPPNVVVGAK